MKQNATLLPYTVNASLPDVPLPVNSANAVVDTSNVMLRAKSSPWRPLTLELQFHGNDHDNKTASNQFDVVVTDATVGTPAINPIYDYKRDTWKLRGEYRAWRALTINLGFSTRDVTREQQDRRTTTTDKLWLELRSRIRGVISLKGDFYSEDRNGSHFVSPDNVVPSQNPLMRKYNLADRRRNGIRLRASLLTFEDFDISAEFESVDDDYRNSSIGLTGSESRRFVIDMTWARRDLVVYLSAANEDIRLDQQNSQSFASPDWAATNRDRFTTGSVGLTWNDLVGELDLQFDYSYNESLGRTDTDTSGRRLEFPDLEGSSQILQVGVRMPLRETMSIGIDYYFEQVRNDDWALDGVMPDTIPTLLSLGAEAWNYSSNVFYINFRYQRD
jgi:MtrB/PioB family decaheme-associated outer membrane protein